MKIFHSLDFVSQQSRIEPTKSGDNLVHTEDFENINDLIRRSVRTKTAFVPEHDKNAVYDDFDYIQNEIDRFEPTDDQTEQNSSKDEQSEVMEQVQGSVVSEQVQMP